MNQLDLKKAAFVSFLALFASDGMAAQKGKAVEGIRNAVVSTTTKCEAQKTPESQELCDKHAELKYEWSSFLYGINNGVIFTNLGEGGIGSFWRGVPELLQRTNEFNRSLSPHDARILNVDYKKLGELIARTMRERDMLTLQLLPYQAATDDLVSKRLWQVLDAAKQARSDVPLRDESIQNPYGYEIYSGEDRDDDYSLYNNGLAGMRTALAEYRRLERAGKIDLSTVDYDTARRLKDSLHIDHSVQNRYRDGQWHGAHRQTLFDTVPQMAPYLADPKGDAEIDAYAAKERSKYEAIWLKHLDAAVHKLKTRQRGVEIANSDPAIVDMLVVVGVSGVVKREIVDPNSAFSQYISKKAVWELRQAARFMRSGAKEPTYAQWSGDAGLLTAYFQWKTFGEHGRFGDKSLDALIAAYEKYVADGKKK